MFVYVYSIHFLPYTNSYYMQEKKEISVRKCEILKKKNYSSYEILQNMSNII